MFGENEVMELAPWREEPWYIAREKLRTSVSCKLHSQGWKRKGLVALEATVLGPV